MFAEKNPANPREINNNGIDSSVPFITSPSRIYENTFPVKPKISIGFLPYISDNLPQSGLNKNCISENIPTFNPIKVSLINNSFWAKVGRIGITIPKPSRSINTVRNMTNMRLSKC